MPYYYNAQIQWVAYFGTTCELCGKAFSFSIDYLATGGGNIFNLSSGSPKSARADALRKMIYTQNLLRTGNFSSVGVHECPTCGYIQSWMINNAKGEVNSYTLFALTSGFSSVFCLVLQLLKAESPAGRWLQIVVLPLVTVLLAIGFAISIYKGQKFDREFDPNAEVLQNRSPPTIKKSPLVSFSREGTASEL